MPTSLALALAAAAGAAAGVFLDPSQLAFVPWVLVMTGLLAMAAATRQSLGIARVAGSVAVAAGASLLGTAALHEALYPPLRSVLEQRIGGFAIDAIETGRPAEPIVIEGRLASDATPTGAGASIRVRVERIWIGGAAVAARGGAALTVSGGMAATAAGDWRSGRRIRAPALLRRPATYLNAGVPDQERLLARRGIALVGSIKSAALVEVADRGSWLDEAAAACRAAIRTAMARHVGIHDPQSAAVATAILIGDRGSLGAAVERRLQEAGTYHVIAISGGNIAILAALVLGLLWAAGVRGAIAAAVAVIVLVLYAFVAGGGASVTRATAMAAIYLSLRLIDQRTAPSHAMALTAAAVLVASPLSIADVGFWLTFGATAAIVAGAKHVPLPASRWLRVPVALVLASACAELMLMPIGAAVFQRVTLAGLVLNLAAVPCMAAVQVGAMVTAAADAVGFVPLSRLAGTATHWAVRGLVDSAALVDLAPWLTWRVPSPPWSIVMAYYVALIGWFLCARAPVTRTRRVMRVAFGSLAAAGFAWIAIAPPTLARVFGDGRLQLTVLDVGQGDAMLVTLPNGRRLLVDTGGVSLRGEFDIGDRVIGPALRAKGIGRLDYLALTHGDPDHIGGAWSLVRDFAPHEIWDGVFVANHEPTGRVRQAALDRRAGWRRLQAGDRLELGGAEVRVHHPPLPDWERQRVRNDDSLVIELRHGRVSMLLTGDIGRDVERALLPNLDLLPIVILKSPHHGSGTSSSEEFVQAIQPKVVVISCGRGNPYGHPLPYVLDRYRAIHAHVFRTDQDGQIEIATDGETVSVSTFTGRVTQIR